MPPADGGATPIIVPLSLLLAAGSAAGAGAPGGAAIGIGGVTPGTAGPPCWFIISIVPLNLGAAAPLTLKPHFSQVTAVSGFGAPQLGQNTQIPRWLGPTRLQFSCTEISGLGQGSPALGKAQQV